MLHSVNYIYSICSTGGHFGLEADYYDRGRCYASYYGMARYCDYHGVLVIIMEQQRW